MSKRADSTSEASTREERDLTWALRSPALPCAGTSAWQDQPWFDSLARLQEPIHSSLPKQHRLGYYFEDLIEAFISATPGYNLIKRGLQVFGEARRTVGEFDLLVETPSGLEHWELAVKFYLLAGDSNDPYHFFGPDPSDQLGKKLAHMQDRQLQLAGTPAGQDALRELGISEVTVRGWMKGRLYYPVSDFINNLSAFPASINASHLQGWWCTGGQFLEHYERHWSGLRMIVLPKLYWLAPIHLCQDELTVIEPDEIVAVTRVTQVAVAAEDGKEISRGFIVPERWLGKVQSPSSETS